MGKSKAVMKMPRDSGTYLSNACVYDLQARAYTNDTVRRFCQCMQSYFAIISFLAFRRPNPDAGIQNSTHYPQHSVMRTLQVPSPPPRSETQLLLRRRRRSQIPDAHAPIQQRNRGNHIPRLKQMPASKRLLRARANRDREDLIFRQVRAP